MAFINKTKYQINKRDVGCTEDNLRRGENVFAPLGYVQPQDIGKRCVKVNKVWFVENEKQFKDRKNGKN